MGRKTQHPILNTLINLILRCLITALAFFLGIGLLIIFTNLQSSHGFRIIPKSVYSDSIISLPPSSPPKPHPLPPTLAQWQDSTNSGDYFSQVTTTQVGCLVWSQFPVRVYVEPPRAVNEKQAQAWVNAVLQGVQEWNTYLPLTIVEQPEIADITIVRKAPPLQISPGSIPRARSAQTTYELYTSNKVLSHRFTILLSPSQTGEYLIAAARHEFGHALGIWGHSPLQTDALYFSQVRNPSPISYRDVNTLKRVYEQPTSLGWSLVNNSKIN
ncbi:putative Zn-dependent protease [Nostoc flagelliforme CCNUN1]|uniref:Putative Zn-dependent protease n=1 Tax=Nostoc flagelliforme CCNUN1 TaxID=2038116 RepID=A0A2K8SZ34_9NOSO|nr:peptidase [Nostoc flagelliforme]AUB40613.1 putative Zn-dependent protease [Nostoc flagelliforme CCNUN1]